MKQLKALALLSVLSLSVQQARSYDVVDRYKIIDDKLKTEQMLRPFGHDFFLDVGAALNKNATDFVDDVKKANDFQGSDAAKLANAQTVLAKYDKTEQTVKFNVALGLPIFSFSIGKLKVQPNLRAFADGGANIGIRSERLTTAKVLELVNIDLPPELKAAVLAQTITPGGDIIAPLCPGITDPLAKAVCQANIGKYFYPSNMNAPDMLLYAKIDGRVGLFNEYTYEDHFFGNFNLYALSRTDIFQRVNSDMIAKGTKIELPKKKNTEMTLQTDMRFGYRNDNYSLFTSLEDIKITSMKKREEGSKELSYKYDPLLRLHGEALYKFSAFSLKPFVGFHKRSGYGFSDGMYAGTDAGAHVWGDRLGVQLRGMVDKQYFTLSPRLKLWLIQLEYSMKTPMKSMDGDVKLSAIHSLDFRLFF